MALNNPTPLVNYEGCETSGQWRPPIHCCRDLTEEICLKEAKLFLEMKRDPNSSELAKKIKSRSDFEGQPDILLSEFKDKKWYLNHELGGNYDAYQRLCLWETRHVNWIGGFRQYHKIGSSLESDMVEYPKFLLKVFEAIKRSDTEKEALEKAIEIQGAASMPYVNDHLLAQCVRECRVWRFLLELRKERLEMLSLLYYGVILKKQDFGQVLHEIYLNKGKSFPFLLEVDRNGKYSSMRIKRHFEMLCVYVDSLIPKVEAKDEYEALVVKFVDEKLLHKMCPSTYVEYVTEKVNLAIELGILNKEHVQPYVDEREKLLSLILTKS